ncbi:MAG: PadR family transcriptional regulator [Lactobacillales bacterium]|jgi:DNA-binding PadR family transcriptional regulator|nr:PadR family transcriptional regulator [Lactobacillales bacterium]
MIGREKFEMRGGFRARRGMIQPAVLSVLLDGDKVGYEIMSSIEEKTQGMWRPSPGSIYPALTKLEEKGLVTVTEEEGDKKRYSLTDEGRTIGEHHKKLFIKQFANRGGAVNMQRELRPLMMGLMEPLKKIGKQNNPEKMAAVLAKFEQLKKDLEEIEGE